MRNLATASGADNPLDTLNVCEGFYDHSTQRRRGLCSKSEWELVESSFSPVVETLPPSDLKSRIDRVRKLHWKTTDLVSRQHSDSRKRTTRRKSELFAEAVARFEAALDLVENAN